MAKQTKSRTQKGLVVIEGSPDSNQRVKSLVAAANNPVIESNWKEQTPMSLMSQAISSKGMSIEVLERLMAMDEKYRARIAREEFMEAMAKFQSIVPPIIKNKSVGYEHKDKVGRTDYDYAPLSTIEQTIRPALAECGLSYRWDQKEGEDITVVCIVGHRGGHQEVSSPLSGKPDTSGGKTNSIHAKASTITYLRRYTLTGILGLSSAEKDDDGQGGAKVSADPVNELPFISDSQMQTAVKNVMLGAWLVDRDILTKVRLRAEQEEALRKLEQDAPKQSA